MGSEEQAKKMFEFFSLLEATGLSKAQLADALGVTPGAVIHWSLGRREIPESVMRTLRFLNRRGISLAEFKMLSVDLPSL